MIKINNENSINLPIEKLGKNWQALEDEGELKLDIFETPEALVVRTTLAGVRPEDLDIFLHNDMLTIRGKREENKEVSKKDYYLRECFWGKFSRSLVLPKHVTDRGAEATLKNGMLTIQLQKAEINGNITVTEEE